MHVLDWDIIYDYINTILGYTRIQERYSQESKLDTNKVKANNPYPWFDKYYHRRNMTDKEILEKYVDLTEACIRDRQKRYL